MEKKTKEKTTIAQDFEKKQFQLEELHKYKLMALTSKLEKEKDRIRGPILERKQKEFSEEFQNALENDSAFQKTSEKQKKAINEIIESSANKLPEGYAITRIDPDNGSFEAEYDPERANQLIET